VLIEDPTGNTNSVRPDIKATAENTYRVTYTPRMNGTHYVTVTFAGSSIPKSPFEVPITLRTFVLWI